MGVSISVMLAILNKKLASFAKKYIIDTCHPKKVWIFYEVHAIRIPQDAAKAHPHPPDETVHADLEHVDKRA